MPSLPVVTTAEAGKPAGKTGSIGYENGKKQFKIPKGLRSLLEEMACEVLREQPDDIYGFLADYLEARLAGKPMPPSKKNDGAGNQNADPAAKAKRDQSILEAVTSFGLAQMLSPDALLKNEDDPEYETDENGRKIPRRKGNEDGSKGQGEGKAADGTEGGLYGRDSKGQGEIGSGRGPNDPAYNPNDPIEKQRALIGISKVELGKGIPPGTSPSKAALFAKIDNAILQGLQLVEYLESARDQYMANPIPGKGQSDNARKGLLKNRPSRAEITEHVDVALANAFTLRDGIDQILRDHSGDGPMDPAEFEADQRALLKQRQDGGIPLEPASTLAVLSQPSQAELSAALVARVDKLNTVVARALGLVDELDQIMDQGQQPSKRPAGRSIGGERVVPTGEGPPDDELEYILQYGGAIMGGSKVESEAQFSEGRADGQAALQKAIDESVQLLKNGGKLTPEQIQLLLDSGLISPSKAQLLRDGGSLSPSQIKLIADKNNPAVSASQAKLDGARAKLAKGEQLTPSEIALLTGRGLITPSEAEVLKSGGKLSPSKLEALGLSPQDGDGSVGTSQNPAETAPDAEKTVAEVAADAEKTVAEVAAEAEKAAAEAEAASEAVEAETAAAEAAAAGKAAADAAEAERAAVEAAAAEASAAKTAAELADFRSQQQEEGAESGQLTRSQIALNLVKNGGKPTDSQIKLLADKGHITPSQTLILSQGGTLTSSTTGLRKASNDSEKGVPAAPQPSRIDLTPHVVTPMSDLEIPSTSRKAQEETVTIVDTSRSARVGDSFFANQLRIMHDLLTGRMSMSEAPAQTAALTMAFLMGIVVGYGVVRDILHGRGGGIGGGSGNSMAIHLPDMTGVPQELIDIRKCPLV